MKERGIDYPTAYNTPHLDPDTMRPYRPTFELNKYTLLGPIGETRLLQPPGQGADAPPSTLYLASEAELQKVIKKALDKQFEKPVSMNELKQHSSKAVNLIRVTEIIREKFSNDTCLHFKYDLIPEDALVRAPEIQHNQNSIDSSQRTFFSLEDLSTLITEFCPSKLKKVTPARKVMVYNARQRLRNYDNSQTDLTQDHYAQNYFHPDTCRLPVSYLFKKKEDYEFLVFNKVKRAYLNISWEETRSSWCKDFGHKQQGFSSTLQMINACVSGPSSLRTHLLEHWLHAGGFMTYLAFSQPYNRFNCDWLR